MAHLNPIFMATNIEFGCVRNSKSLLRLVSIELGWEAFRSP